MLCHKRPRIRLAIIQHIPLLAKQLGQNFFTERLSALCVGWLGDEISTIRQAAAKNLMDLTAVFGTEWACEHLLPSIDEIRGHSSYLRRLTAVQACAKMSTEMDPDVAQTELLPIVLAMASDSVRLPRKNRRFIVYLSSNDGLSQPFVRCQIFVSMLPRNSNQWLLCADCLVMNHRSCLSLVC